MVPRELTMAKTTPPTFHTDKTETIDLLLSYKANVDAENDSGWRRLHIVVAYGHASPVEPLMSLGTLYAVKLVWTKYRQQRLTVSFTSCYWTEAHWPIPGTRSLHLAV